jgi:uncharacterized protein (DUF1778 family)
MLDRAVLLVRCSEQEAAGIRGAAHLERRTLSGYVLNVVMRTVAIEEDLFARLHRVAGLNDTLARRPLRPLGPRTAFLVRCTQEESSRIRAMAKKRDMNISAFVLHCLRRSWETKGLGFSHGRSAEPGTPS